MVKKKKQHVEFTCPECGSERVTVEERTMFMANTLDHWRHRVKAHDSDAVADCLDCDWQGVRHHLAKPEQEPKQ